MSFENGSFFCLILLGEGKYSIHRTGDITFQLLHFPSWHNGNRGTDKAVENSMMGSAVDFRNAYHQFALCVRAFCVSAQPSVHALCLRVYLLRMSPASKTRLNRTSLCWYRWANPPAITVTHPQSSELAEYHLWMDSLQTKQPQHLISYLKLKIDENQKEDNKTQTFPF